MTETINNDTKQFNIVQIPNIENQINRIEANRADSFNQKITLFTHLKLLLLTNSKQ